MSATIVVGVDGSKASKRALRWASAQAEITGASLVAVYSWGPIYPVGIDPEEHARNTLLKILEGVLGAERATSVRAVVSPDAAGHLLVNEAAGADMLVVGSHGHGQVAGVLLGSVSEYCLHHADCPVVIVRIPERR
jgi:nucleotide-binding universal stress UspA family protein